MNGFEECNKLLDSTKEYRRKVADLEKEIAEKKKAQDALDEKALESEILEKRNWQRLREKANKNREKISELKEEVGKSKKAVEILEKQKGDIAKKTLKEMKPKYMETYTNAIKDFIEKLRVAEEAERQILKMKDDADKVAAKIDPSGAVDCPLHTFLPGIKTILITGDQDDPKQTKLYFLLRDLEDLGIDVG